MKVSSVLVNYGKIIPLLGTCWETFILKVLGYQKILICVVCLHQVLHLRHPLALVAHSISYINSVLQFLFSILRIIG